MNKVVTYQLAEILLIQGDSVNGLFLHLNRLRRKGRKKEKKKTKQTNLFVKLLLPVFETKHKHVLKSMKDQLKEDIHVRIKYVKLPEISSS
jgi:hypothetical protein